MFLSLFPAMSVSSKSTFPRHGVAENSRTSPRTFARRLVYLAILSFIASTMRRDTVMSWSAA